MNYTYPILFVLVVIAMPVIVISFERRAWKRRIRRERAEFADAYNAWKRAAHDPYAGEVPALYESAEKAGWNLAYTKSRGA